MRFMHLVSKGTTVASALFLVHCAAPDEEVRVYVQDPGAPHNDMDDTVPDTGDTADHEGNGDGDGEGGLLGTLELPFPEDEVWQMTRGYHDGSHMDYGYDWVDDSYALDFAAGGCDSWRKPVTPIRSGTVEVVGWDEDGYGHYVLVDHGDGFKSRYAHLDETSVSSGQAVSQTTELGLVGNSGYVLGSACPDHPGTHLHLAYYEEGEGVPPEPMSGHDTFVAGCWYGRYGWVDCDGDDEPDEETTDGGASSDGGDDGGSSHGGESEEDGGSSGGSSGGEDEEDGGSGSSDCDWNVPDDFTVIQDAMDAASSGDVVCVSAGSYDEDLTFNGKDLTVRGVDGASATHLFGVAVGAYESVVTVESGTSDLAVLEGFTIHPTTDSRGVTVTWSSITLRNLLVDCNEDGSYGLMLEAATGVTVSNTWILDCTQYGVYAPASTGLAFTNVILSGNVSAGLRLNSADATVTNAVFYENGFMGVDARDSSATVANSIFVGHTMFALYVEGSGSLSSEYNAFDDNDAAYAEDVRVLSGNTIEDPQFTDATGEDFTLASGSPCVDDGDSDATFNDADGTRNDKGAYGGPLSESW